MRERNIGPVPKPYATGILENGRVISEAAVAHNSKPQRDMTHVERYIERAKLRGLDISGITNRRSIGRAHLSYQIEKTLNLH